MKTAKANAVLGGTCGLLLIVAGVLAFSAAAPRRATLFGASGIDALPGKSLARVFSRSTAGQRPIHWQQLHSTNYDQFVANLRAFGCPEQTIRDIVMMDIAKVYARKRAEIRRQGRPYEFWRPSDGDEHKVEEQLAELQREQHKLVRDLLGVELITARAQYWAEEDPAEGYDFLAPDKRAQLVEFVARYDEKVDEIFERADGELSPEVERELRALDEQRAREFEALLTPEEREAYELRYSSIAQVIRSEFGGIRPTEEEFQKLFQVYKKYEKDMSEGFAVDQSNRDQFRTPERTTAERAFQAEIREALGETRFAELQRSQDPAYDVLVQLAERLNLGSELPNELYSLKVQAEQQKFEIESNSGLTPEQRRDSLARIARETERAMTAALGPDVYRTYASATGDWLAGLTGRNTQPTNAR